MLRKKFFSIIISFLLVYTFFGSAFLPLGAQQPDFSKSIQNGLLPEERISMKELLHKLAGKHKFVLFDARGKKSYDESHIDGAILPLSPDYYQNEELFRTGIVKDPPDRDKDLSESLKKYPKDFPIVTYCNDHCQASAVLLLQIKHLGFTKVRAMEDGIQSWQAKGYPVAPASGRTDKK